MSFQEDLIRVEATVEGQPVKGIIDTGAKSNVISRSLCETLNLTEDDEEPRVILTTASNQKVIPKKMVTCDVKFGRGRLHRTQLLVLDEFKHGLLFGWRFMQEIGAEISFPKGRITIGDYTCPLKSAKTWKRDEALHLIEEDDEEDVEEAEWHGEAGGSGDGEARDGEASSRGVASPWEGTVHGEAGKETDEESEEDEEAVLTSESKKERGSSDEASQEVETCDEASQEETKCNDEPSREVARSDEEAKTKGSDVNRRQASDDSPCPRSTRPKTASVVTDTDSHQRSRDPSPKEDIAASRQDAGWKSSHPSCCGSHGRRRRNIEAKAPTRRLTDHHATRKSSGYRRVQFLVCNKRGDGATASAPLTLTVEECAAAMKFLRKESENGNVDVEETEAVLVIDEDVARGWETGSHWDTDEASPVPSGLTPVDAAPAKVSNILTDEAAGEDEEASHVADDEASHKEVTTKKKRHDEARIPSFNVGENLTEKQRQLYVELLMKFEEIMAKSGFDVGRVAGIEHEINTEGHAPVALPLRRMNPIETEELRRQVGELVKLGFVRESHGNPWAAPAVLVKKKNGTYRFCIDHRRLNAITKKDRTPLPRIDDVHDRLGGSHFFTSLDFVSGYYHVPLEDSSCEKTGFLTPFGHFEWTRMTMGLCNAPATFQRLMNHVLGPLMYKYCLAYLDDIIIYSKTFEEHLEHVTAVLSRIREAGLKVQPAKSSFGMDKLKYLGSKISADGILVDEDKVKAVQEFPVPRTPTMVRAFLGLTGYYRRFVQNYAREAHPLIELTKKTCGFHWGCEQQASFETLKLKLETAPILKYPDFRRPFYVFCDASNTGLGAILKQKDDEGKERVIAYASRILQPTERKYPTTQKECLAILYAIDQFRYYVSMTKFFVVTDHHSLCYLMKVKKPYGRLTYWALMLQDFDFEIIYKAGANHRDADALSRYPVGYDLLMTKNPDEEPEYDRDHREMCAHVEAEPMEDMKAVEEAEEANRKRHDEARGLNVPDEADKDKRHGEAVDTAKQESLLIIPDDEAATKQSLHLRYLQRQPGKWKSLIDYLADPTAATEATPAFRRRAKGYSLKDGLLVKHFRPGDAGLPVVPYPARKQILRAAHDEPTAGHFGVDRTWARIRDKYYWPQAKSDVRDYVESCRKCLEFNVTRRAPAGLLIPLKPTTKPFVRIGIDKMGPIRMTSRGNQYIYVVTDYCTKTIVTAAAKEGNAIASVKILREVIDRYGAPEELVVDNGREFQNDLFLAVCQEYRIRVKSTAAYNPKANGQTERANDTLSTVIRKFTEENQKDWDLFLSRATYAYNTSEHSTTKMTPFFLLYGFHPPMVVDRDLFPSSACEEDYEFTNLVLLPRIRRWVAEKTAIQQKKMKQEYDQHRSDVEFPEKSFVMLRVPTKVGGDGLSARFRKPYVGPFKIEKKLNDNNYLLSGTRKNMKEIVNVARLKRFVARKQREDDDKVADSSPSDDRLEEDKPTGEQAQDEDRGARDAKAWTRVDDAIGEVQLRRSTRVRKPVDRLFLLDEAARASLSVEAQSPLTRTRWSLAISPVPMTMNGSRCLVREAGTNWTCRWRCDGNETIFLLSHDEAVLKPLDMARRYLGDEAARILEESAKYGRFAVRFADRQVAEVVGTTMTQDEAGSDCRAIKLHEEAEEFIADEAGHIAICSQGREWRTTLKFVDIPGEHDDEAL